MYNEKDDDRAEGGAGDHAPVEEEEGEEDHGPEVGVHHIRDNGAHNKKMVVPQRQAVPGEKWLHQRADCWRGCVLLHMDTAAARAEDDEDSAPRAADAEEEDAGDIAANFHEDPRFCACARGTNWHRDPSPRACPNRPTKIPPTKCRAP